MFKSEALGEFHRLFENYGIPINTLEIKDLTYATSEDHPSLRIVGQQTSLFALDP